METIRRETSDDETIRLQTGSAPWNVYSTYDRYLVRGDFSTPLRFARNDGERKVSAPRYPLSAYRGEKDGLGSWNLRFVVPLWRSCIGPPQWGGKVVRSTKGGRGRSSRRVLRIDRPHGGRVLKIDAAWGCEGCGIALRCTANTFCTMRTGFVREHQRPENPVSQ